MSHEHAIDGDEHLFPFDNLDLADRAGPSTSAADCAPKHSDLSDMSHIPHFSNIDLSSFSSVSTPAEIVDFISNSRAFEYKEEESLGEVNIKGKGKDKAVSHPLDIASRGNSDSHFDSFSFTSAASGSNRTGKYISSPSSFASTPHTLASFAFSPSATPFSIGGSSVATSYRTEITTPGSLIPNNDFSEEEDAESRAVKELKTDKGKARSEAPVLPPLTFGTTEMVLGETNWPLEGPGSAVAEAPPFLHETSAIVFPSSDSPPAQEVTMHDTPAFLHRVPTRTRSFSSLSTKSAKSFAAQSVSKLKLSFAKGSRPSNLARKLLLKKRQDDLVRPYIDFEHSIPATTSAVKANHKHFTSFSEPSTPYALAYSSLLAETDANDANGPLSDERLLTLDLFNQMLPKEMKLRVFTALLDLHDAEGESITRSADWTVLKASKKENRWMGRNKGFLELVRVSRVCKSWQQLVFDGQLWAKLDLQAFPTIPSHHLLRLAEASGSFVRHIDFNGLTRLLPSSLVDITKSLCIPYNLPDGQSPVTQLTSINLSGCSLISTYALRNLFIHSPLLTNLKLKGLKAVTNDTCRILAEFCPGILCLDLTRCDGMDVDGIISLLRPHQIRQTVSPMKELKIAGLKRASDTLMSLLGRYAPNLEVLDLSCAHELQNQALQAYITIGDDEDMSNAVLLTSRDVGRDPGDPTKYWRRVTKLRHLSLSSCHLLSDIGCSHLAHALPRLELLELAGIGVELKDDGLIRLLRTTPCIRRLDLEEACDITDAVLEALTPKDEVDNLGRPPSSQPGSKLEQLNLSYAMHLTNDAVLSLIHSCIRLKHLELDSTRISGSTVKEFVRLSRKRQAVNAQIVSVDCRSVGESAVKDLVGSTRTRKGWRSWDAKRFHYLDSRDEEALGVGQDECDEKRVVLKTFYSWQTVDAVETAREKRRKSSKNGQDSRSESEEDYFSLRKGPSRWFSSIRTSGTTSPTDGADRDRESCTIM